MAQAVRSRSYYLSMELPARHSDVLRVIGFLQLQYGNPSDAIVVFDVLRAAFPSDRKIAMSLALAWLRKGEPQSALDVLDDIQSPPPADSFPLAAFLPDALDPCFHLLRGQALAGLGRLAEAARAMRLFMRQRRLLENQDTR